MWVSDSNTFGYLLLSVIHQGGIQMTWFVVWDPAGDVGTIVSENYSVAMLEDHMQGGKIFRDGNIIILERFMWKR
jgi:hypothetical protein